jgi:cobalt/nickel transport system permease protein
MHHDFLDKYSRLDSPIHRLAPGWKLGATLGVLLLLVGLPVPRMWPAAAVVLLGLLLVALRSRVPPTYLLGRLLLLEPLVAGAALLGLLQPGGGLLALAIVVRSTLCLAATLLLANTTPFSDLLALLRTLRVPPSLVTVLALMYRYLFVLVDETERMQRARHSRTFTRKRTHLWKAYATLVAELFVRSTERAERIYAAMCARGWR